MRIGLSGGMSMPEIRGISSYPCFCLCLVFVQMTRTTPLRRTILQFSQIRLTLARTFMTASVDYALKPAAPGESVFIA
jgi:hypothetical protein